MNFKKVLSSTLVGLTLMGISTLGVSPSVEAKKNWTMDEAKMQYSFFYNFARRSGVGHLDASTNSRRQLRNHGFPAVDGQFRSTVMKCFNRTGDAYCWAPKY